MAGVGNYRHKYGITFNGRRMEELVTLRGKRRPPWAPLKRNLIEVPGMAGAHLQRTDTEPRTLEVPVLIESNDLQDLQYLKEEIANWLVTDTPKELVFDDEPDRMYYAMVDGGFEVDELIRVGVGMLKFICIDPYKYSTTNNTRSLSSSTTIVRNEGTVDTYPVFRATVTQPITHLDIVSQDSYMRIGAPHTVDDVKYEPEVLILNDQMNSLSGWGSANQVDNGYVSGNINTDGNSFYPESYGQVIDQSQWQGPSLKKTLPESLEHFRLEAYVKLVNSNPVTTGMIEIYLLDNSNNVVGKIGIEDRFEATVQTFGKARVGNAHNGLWFSTEVANDAHAWIDFDGVIKLYRTGREWFAYYAVIDSNGNHIWKRGSNWNIRYYDVDGKFTSIVSQVQVAFRIHPNTERAPMYVKQLKVYKLNPREYWEEPKIPYIAQPGDVIEIDHKTNDIRINGESRIDLKDFGSSFFSLKKGDNALAVYPNTVNATVSWRERYL